MIARAGLVLAALAAGASALQAPRASIRRPKLSMSAEVSLEKGTVLQATSVENKKQERRRIMKSPDFLRKNGDFIEEKAAVDAKMLSEMKSEMLDKMRESNYEVTRGEGNGAVTFTLAKEYGMCWGAERSIEIALAATEKCSRDEGVSFIEKTGDGGKRFDDVKEGDVVILPAFGATLAEMQHFSDMGVTTVDTTCPWVTKVWNVVDKQVQRSMTTIIHGKYAHEEAIATASMCDDYLMVKNIDEAEYAMSKGFDPDVHLEKIGIANQTTMYKKETQAVAASSSRSGRTPSTRWSTTSVKDLDFILVVGGFDSSNTAHLVEIPDEAGIPVFHINEADCISETNAVSHRLVSGEMAVEENWPDGPARASASRPRADADAVQAPAPRPPQVRHLDGRGARGARGEVGLERAVF
ncbi:4-hydroxy-3-methylbut-2-en-1-yl diphosphate reductase [Aureococcus anophagefferens]|nr:4-hydroxy-3-methylbut-2-en-1-yl diphosphate reductase [Aureococcus anophagefferens]